MFASLSDMLEVIQGLEREVRDADIRAHELAHQIELLSSFRSEALTLREKYAETLKKIESLTDQLAKTTHELASARSAEKSAMDELLSKRQLIEDAAQITRSIEVWRRIHA